MFASLFLVKGMGVGVVERLPNQKVPVKGQETQMVGKITSNSIDGQLLQFLLSCPFYPHSCPEKGL